MTGEDMTPAGLSPEAAYALAVAAVGADGEEEGFVAEPDEYWVQPSGALSWCFSTKDMAPGCFFVHVRPDRAVTFTTLPYEDEVLSDKFTAEECEVRSADDVPSTANNEVPRTQAT